MKGIAIYEEHRDTNESHGGEALTAGDYLRACDAEIVNTIPDVVNNDGVVTVPGGRYDISAIAPFTGSAGHRLVLEFRRSSDNEIFDVVSGRSCVASGSDVSNADVNCHVYFPVDMKIALYHRITAGSLSTGVFGIPANDGGEEVYAQLIIRKVD